MRTFNASYLFAFPGRVFVRTNHSRAIQTSHSDAWQTTQVLSAKMLNAVDVLESCFPKTSNSESGMMGGSDAVKCLPAQARKHHVRESELVVQTFAGLSALQSHCNLQPQFFRMLNRVYGSSSHAFVLLSLAAPSASCRSPHGDLGVSLQVVHSLPCMESTMGATSSKAHSSLYVPTATCSSTDEADSISALPFYRGGESGGDSGVAETTEPPTASTPWKVTLYSIGMYQQLKLCSV